MDVKKKTGGAVVVSTLLISVVPALILSCALAAKGAFLSRGFEVFIKAICALAAAAVAVFAASSKETRLKTAQAALCYLMIFAFLFALVAVCSKIFLNFIMQSRVRALPYVIGGVLQAAALPACLFRLVNPGTKKHVGVLSYLACTIFALLAGMLLQIEDMHLLIFNKYLNYATITASFAIKFASAMLAALFIRFAVNLLKKDEVAEAAEKPGMLKLIVPAAIAFLTILLSSIFCKVSTYQYIKDDVATLVYTGTEYAKAGAIDLAEFNFRKAINHRDGWSKILKDDNAHFAYSAYNLDLDMLCICAVDDRDCGMLESALQQNHIDRGINASLFYLYTTNKPEDWKEHKGDYYNDVLSFLAANRIYTREFGDASELSETQKEKLQNYFDSLSGLNPLRKALQLTQDYGRLEEYDYWDAYVLARDNPENLFVQYFSAAYMCLGVGDDANRDYIKEVIDRFVTLGESSLDGKELALARERALEMYMTCGLYDKAYAIAEKVSTKTAAEKDRLNLIKLNCLNHLDRMDECGELAKSMVKSGSHLTEAYFFSGIAATKNKEYQEALNCFCGLCSELKPNMNSDQIYEIERCMMVLAEYITLRDSSIYTDYTYGFYRDLSAEDKAELMKNPLAYHYLEGMYYVFRTSELNPAIEHLDAVTDSNDKLSLAWYLKGAIYFDKEIFDKAAEMMEKSLALHDDVPAVMYSLANVYDAQGRLEEAYELSLRVDATYRACNHEKDWFGLSFHNPYLLRKLEQALEEKKGGNAE